MRLSLPVTLLICSISSAALAQQATTPVPPTLDAAKLQVQQLLKSKKSQEALGQAMALTLLVNCTQKTAGKEATQAFYQQMQGVGEQVRAACKRQDAQGAQRIVLATLDAKKSDPVLKGAVTCYDSQSGAIQGLAGQKTADEIAYYARFARDPAAAHQHMQPSDICR